jgi:hypothetical protein
MIALPGSVEPEAIAGMIADEICIGVINQKTTSVRVIPVPGKEVGDRAVFGGLFGESAIAPVCCPEGCREFVRKGGRIPAPLQSLNN